VRMDTISDRIWVANGDSGQRHSGRRPNQWQPDPPISFKQPLLGFAFHSDTGKA
jgi:hypothetical protein